MALHTDLPDLQEPDLPPTPSGGAAQTDNWDTSLASEAIPTVGTYVGVSQLEFDSEGRTWVTI
eukprot:13361729-Heterocapsa_arctica.AAC.1